MKTWFITGTSSGFGRYLTEFALGKGDRVAATLRDTSVLKDLQTQFRDQLWVRKLDVTNCDEVQNVMREAFLHFGRIDYVVSNAGYALFGAAEEYTDHQIRNQIETNLIGSISVIRASLPHLRRQNGGRIIQISSMGGQIAFPLMSVYHATKFGIEGFVESVGQEVSTFGIEITLVEPGSVQTNFGTKNIIISDMISDYDSTPAGQFRKAKLASRTTSSYGDAKKVAQAILKSVDIFPAPKRLVLGSDAYKYLQQGLSLRLQDIESQKNSASETDSEQTLEDKKINTN